MEPRTILLSGDKFGIVLDRLCYQLIENHGDLSGSALIGLQPRGVYLAKALHKRLQNILHKQDIAFGMLDTTFHRDDFRRHKAPLLPSSVSMDMQVEDKAIILVDDVLYTGRTIRAGLDALLDFGRPGSVELLVLVDRRYSRQLPIEPSYTGLAVDTRAHQKVKVNWEDTEGENSIWLLNEAKEINS